MELWRELDALGIEYHMNVVHSQTGRVMQVRGMDAGDLPASFAPGIPDEAYVVVEAADVGTIPAG